MITPKCKCLKCGYTFNATTGVITEDIPKEGDISVCVKCAALAAFTGELTIRALTNDELLALMSDQEAQDLISKIRLALRKTKE